MSKKDVYGIVLAGGVGTRMGNVEKPKQFMEIGGKPIIIHTIEKFVLCPEFDRVLVLTPKQWIKHTEDLIKKYLPAAKDVVVIAGGDTRNETIMNAIKFIDENDGLTDDTIIVTHDSVRPFVTSRIIMENIENTKKYGACDTCVAATDTIVECMDGKVVSSIPDRSKMYQGQTPQSFKAKRLRDLYNDLTVEEKEILTDATKICVIRGEQVYLVQGEVYNIKITYPYDLKVAEALLKGEMNA